MRIQYSSTESWIQSSTAKEMASGPSHGERGSQTCRVVTKIFAQAIVEHTSVIWVDEIEFQSLEYANLCGYYILLQHFIPIFVVHGTRFVLFNLVFPGLDPSRFPRPSDTVIAVPRWNSKRSDWRCSKKIHDCGVNLPAEWWNIQQWWMILGNITTSKWFISQQRNISVCALQVW